MKIKKIKTPKAKIIIPIVLTAPLAITSFFFDGEILEFMRFLHNPLFNKIASWLSESESFIFVLIIMAGVFLFEVRKAKWILPLLSTFLISFAGSYLLKLIFMRRRPFDATGALGFADSSFPSTHAMMAFAIATLLYQEFPRIGWFFYLFAIAIALSRVYLEKHYLSDVLVGSLLGYLIGTTIIWFTKRYIFKTNLT